jgi:hypothetical protein
MQTPWGKADLVTDLGGNVSVVSTPSHGGIRVPFETLLNALSPAQLAYCQSLGFSRIGVTNWAYFEEDCDALIPLLCLPGLFERYVSLCRPDLSAADAKALKASLVLSFSHWHPAWPTDAQACLDI